MRRQHRSLLVAASLAVAAPLRAEPGPEVGVEVRDEPLDRASRAEPSAAATVVRGRRLSRPGSDLPEVLAEVPGTALERRGSSADLATASLRGATSSQVPVYLGGVRINDDVTGTADLSQVPLFMLDRVEVYRGTSPEAVDRMGIGGAILLEPRLPKRPSVGAGVAVGSFGARSAWLGGAAAASGSSALVGVRHERADNDFAYTDDAGTAFVPGDDREVRRENADHSAFDLWATSRSELGRDAQVVTLFNGFRREQGVTGLGVIPAERARARVERVLGAIRTRVPCPLVAQSSSCRLELATSALLGLSHIDDPWGELAVGAPSVESRGRRVTESAHVSFDAGDALRLRFGGSEELEQLAIDALAPVVRARRSVSRADAGARLALDDDLSLATALALERHVTEQSAEATSRLSPGARLGLEWRVVQGLSVLSNLGRYERVPTLGELHGVSAVVLGNPELVAERGTSWDAGIRGGFRGRALAFSGDLFGFVRFADELIAYRRSSLGVIRPYNVGSARVLGLEAQSALVVADHVELDLAATLLDPRDTSEGRTTTNDLLPYQSRLSTFARLELFARRALGFDRMHIAGSFRQRGSRVAEPAGLIVIADQKTVGADAGVALLSNRLKAGVAVENLLDEEQYDAVGLPLPRRKYSASAELWW